MLDEFRFHLTLTDRVAQERQPDVERALSGWFAASLGASVPVDALALFTEVYDNVGKTPHRVEITTTVLADDGHEVRKTTDERKSDELHGPGGGYGYTTQLPLPGLAPGRYVLRVAALHTLGNGEPISRDVEFRVR